MTLRPRFAACGGDQQAQHEDREIEMAVEALCRFGEVAVLATSLGIRVNVLSCVRRMLDTAETWWSPHPYMCGSNWVSHSTLIVVQPVSRALQADAAASCLPESVISGFIWRRTVARHALAAMVRWDLSGSGA